MSSQVTTAYAKQYEGMFKILSQQMVSKFMPRVMVKVVNSADEWYHDQIGSVSVSTVTGQRNAISLGNTPHSRRQLTKARYYFADTVEEHDVANMLSDPLNAYTQNAMMALKRQIDSTIITAAFADAQTGVEGGTTTTFASEGTTVAAASAGLTIDKLKEVRKAFQDNDVPYSRINLAIGPEQELDLLGMPEFINSDYRRGSLAMDGQDGGLVDGYVGRLLDFDIFRSTLLAESGGTRDCIAWVNDGIALGVGIAPQAIITNRSDLQGNPVQVEVNMQIGAARLDGEKVVKLQCVES